MSVPTAEVVASATADACRRRREENAIYCAQHLNLKGQSISRITFFMYLFMDANDKLFIYFVLLIAGVVIAC